MLYLFFPSISYVEIYFFLSEWEIRIDYARL